MTSESEASWLEVSLTVSPEAAEAVAEVLSRYAPQGVAIDMGDPDGRNEDEEESKTVIVKAYLAMDETIEARRLELSTAIDHLRHIWPQIPAPSFTPIQDQDWTAGWKESIPVLHLTERVVIKPSWRDYEPQPDEIVLEMDPGMAFGTGLHPSTQLCAEGLVAWMQPEYRILDLGTGTGILALIAAKLDATEILAVDNDIDAVAVARRNARHNHAAHAIRHVHGSLPDISGAYDLVLANLLAPILIKMARAGLASRVQRNGLLIASGVLEEQMEEVVEVFKQEGLYVVEVLQQEDWVALVMRKTHSVPPSLSQARRPW